MKMPNPTEKFLGWT